MKNLESMPTPAQEPERLEVEDEDIDKLITSFEHDRRAYAVEKEISETTAEHSMQDMEKIRAESTGIVTSEAGAAAESVVGKDLDEAIKLMEQGDPEVAVMTLLKPVNERLRAKLDPAGGFDMPHGDPRIQKAYDAIAEQLNVDAINAVKTALEKRAKALADGDPKKAEIGRLIGLVAEGALEKPEPQEEIQPLAGVLEPEPPAPPKKKGFFQRLLGR